MKYFVLILLFFLLTGCYNERSLCEKEIKGHSNEYCNCQQEFNRSELSYISCTIEKIPIIEQTDGHNK